MGHIFGLNPLDENSLTAGLIEGRKQAVEFESYYREYIPDYEDVELAVAASLPVSVISDAYYRAEGFFEKRFANHMFFRITFLSEVM